MTIPTQCPLPCSPHTSKVKNRSDEAKLTMPPRVAAKIGAAAMFTKAKAGKRRRPFWPLTETVSCG